MNLMELVSYITVDKTGFDKGISQAGSTAKDFATKIDNVAGKVKKALTAAFSIAAVKKLGDAIVGLANDTAAYGDRIDKQSQVLGLSRKAYQEWDYILSQNGASIDSMSTSMKTLNSLILDAAAGGKESKNAFAKLGVSIHELEQLSVEDQFETVVRAFQKMPEGAKKSALAVQIFGKAGMDLLPLLNQSETSIDELRQRAQELGIIMSDDAIDASVAYGDAMDDLKKTFNGIKYALGAQLLPSLTKGVSALTNYAAKISRAYQQNGLKGVFDTLVADFKTIKWPTWDDVKTAVETAWKTIVDNVKNLGGLVFGENKDGTVNWPEWSDVQDFAQGLWDDLVGFVADLGGMIFGKDENGEVNWPSLEDMQTYAQGLWDDLKEFVAKLGGIIFGKNEEGEVNWPTWDDVKTAAETAWNTIKENVENLGGILFGKNEKGEVNWPTWDDVRVAAEAAWETIKENVENFGGIFFGKNEKGEVNWPTWDDVVGAATEAWNTIKTEAAKLTGLMFGISSDDTEALKTLGDTIEIIAGAIGAGMVAANISSAFTAIKGLFTLPTASFNPVLLAISGIAAGAIFIAQNWETIYGWIERATDAMLNFFGIQTHYTEKDVRQANVDALSAAVGQLTEQASNQDRQGAIETIKGLLNTRARDFLTEEQKMRIKSDQFGNTQEEVDAFLGDIYSTLTKSLGEEEAALAVVEEAMASLSGEMSALEESAASASSALASITAPDLTPYMSHAKGLWDVPYDGYLAKLHRGERVLTASQARRQENGGYDLSGLGSEITQAIRAGMQDVTVKSYLSGRDVTDNVNRNTSRMLKARRFAT